MPTLIVEDGSGVADANTYVDEAFLVSYADDRGLTISPTGSVRQQQLLKAMDYLESQTGRFQGSKTLSTYSLPWPRKEVYIHGVLIDKHTIPIQLKNAQSQIVVELQAGTRLYPIPRTSSVEGFVTQKTIGPLTKKYAQDGLGTIASQLPIRIATVELFLKQLIGNSNSSLNTYRA